MPLYGLPNLNGDRLSHWLAAARDAFSLRGGQPKIYVKTAESGAKRAQAFCPECGTPIYSAAVTDPQIFNIRVGTARQRSDAAKFTRVVPIRARLGYGSAFIRQFLSHGPIREFRRLDTNRP